MVKKYLVIQKMRREEIMQYTLAECQLKELYELHDHMVLLTSRSCGFQIGFISLSTSSVGSLSKAELGGAKVVYVPSEERVSARPAASSAAT